MSNSPELDAGVRRSQPPVISGILPVPPPESPMGPVPVAATPVGAGAKLDHADAAVTAAATQPAAAREVTPTAQGLRKALKLAAHIGSGLAAWGAIFWVLVGLIPSQEAEILLAITPGKAATQAAPGAPLVIAGTVLEAGTSRAGHLQLVVDNPKTSEHKVSTLVQVQERVVDNAQFRVELDINTKDDAAPEALRIRAHFVGTGKGGSPIEGDAVAYAHCSSRIHQETLLKGFILLGALALLVTVLFTADLTQETAKFLFGATYLTCFLSVTAPIAVLLLVSENRYLIELMRESPVGLVQAQAQGLERPQWFLNVGGIVEEQSDPPRWASRRSRRALAAPAANGAGGAEQPVAAKPDGTPVDPAAKKAERPPAYEIEGGLAIPFSVIILAVFGAGISMMRNVPEIQKTHLSKLKETGRNPLLEVLLLLIAPFLKNTPRPDEQHEGCCVRKKIIDQYMYLLSAPFLAIAVYYLLQIVAQNVAEPVLVLMAFSAGLISERIVSSIVEFADKTLGGQRAKAKDQAASTPAGEEPTAPSIA